MAKITVNKPEEGETAPAAASSAPDTVPDKRGRVLGIRKLTALDKFRIKRWVGGDDAMNLSLMLDIFAAASCSSIDGEPEIIPMNMRQAEALIAQLGDDGLVAIYRHMQAEQGLTDDDIEAAKK